MPAVTGVGGVGPEPLLPPQVGHSFGFETLATLLTVPVSVDGMLTTSVNTLEAFATITFGLVQTTFVVPVQVQSVPLKLLSVIPDCRLSVTVVVPVEFDGPLFITVMV